MAKNDDEIFKRLSKEKPLLKRKDLQPSPARDYAHGAEPRYAAIPKKPMLRNPATRGAELASRYNQRQSSEAVPNQGMTIIGEEAGEAERPVRKQSVKVKAAVSDNVERRAEPASPARKEVNRDRGQSESKSKVPRQPASRQEPVIGAQDETPKLQKREGYTRTKAAGEAASNLDLFTEHTGSPMVRERAYGQAIPARRSSVQDTELLPDAPINKELSFRHELKYYINYHDYVLLRNTLKPLLSLDSNTGDRGDYHIRSLYFDDVYETALVQKMGGNDIRSKYRIRIYDFSDNVIKFEKKYKQGQYIAKTSFQISRDECEALMAGDCSCLYGRHEPLAEEVLLQMKNNLLTPRVIVDYRREAYISPFENVRITFDKDIKAGLWLTDIFNPNAPTMPVLEPGTMVLEVKFNRYLPVFIKAVLNNVNAAQRSAVSKYVLCRKYE